jgi:hypothetical protein
MASDMLVALARSTQDGHTYFGHNTNRPPGEATSVVRAAGHEFAPGETVALPRARLPQARRTFTVLAGRAGGQWGYQHGVNDKGVAVGCTPIRTRLGGDASLTGPDLVRLALERAASACQAVELVTDLVGRHGVDAHAFLVADHEEAVVLEAGERHWALAEIGSVRAVTGACLLRQDWDRISRGLSDAAIRRGWWPDDGRKLDFAAAVGAAGPDHARDLRRWGQATLALEQHSGHLDAPRLRGLLGHQAELTRKGGGGQVTTVASALVRLSPNPDEPPVCWYAPCPPDAGVYLPLLLDTDPPPALAALRAAPPARGEDRAELQQRLDDHLHEYLHEASALRRQGRRDELRRLAGSFLQYVVERVEEALPAARREEELAQTW